jgi:hypothetical protein
MACDDTISTFICHISPIVRTATETDALTQSATIRIQGSIGNRRLALLYNGATLSRFSLATLKARFAKSGTQSTATLQILADPRVTTAPAIIDSGPVGAVAVSLRKNDSSFGTGVPFGVFNSGINVAHLENQVERGGYDPATDSNSIFVGAGDRVDVLTSDGKNDGSIQLTVGGASNRDQCARVACDEGRGRRCCFATDRTCALCAHNHGIGVIAIPIEPGLGPPTPVQVLGNRIDFPRRRRGVRWGLAALSDNQGAPASESASLCRSSQTASTALPSILETPDGGVSEQRDSAARCRLRHKPVPEELERPNGVGAEARFNFSGTNHVGMAFRPHVLDAHKRFILQIRVTKRSDGFASTRNAVSTYAILPGPPVGVTLDPFSGKRPLPPCRR